MQIAVLPTLILFRSSMGLPLALPSNQHRVELVALTLLGRTLTAVPLQMAAPILKRSSFLATRATLLRIRWRSLEVRRRASELCRSANQRRRAREVIGPTGRQVPADPVLNQLLITPSVQLANLRNPLTPVRNLRHPKTNTLMPSLILSALLGRAGLRSRSQSQALAPVPERRSYRVHSQRSELSHQGNPYLPNLCAMNLTCDRYRNRLLIGPANRKLNLRLPRLRVVTKDHRSEVVAGIVNVIMNVTMSDVDRTRGSASTLPDIEAQPEESAL